MHSSPPPAAPISDKLVGGGAEQRAVRARRIERKKLETQASRLHVRLSPGLEVSAMAAGR